jgi:hypothetical protein
MSRRKKRKIWGAFSRPPVRTGTKRFRNGDRVTQDSLSSSPADKKEFLPSPSCRPIPCPIPLNKIHCPFSSHRNPSGIPGAHRRNQRVNPETPNHRGKSFRRAPLKYWPGLNICQYVHFTSIEDIYLKSSISGQSSILRVKGRSPRYPFLLLNSSTMS